MVYFDPIFGGGSDILFGIFKSDAPLRAMIFDFLSQNISVCDMFDS